MIEHDFYRLMDIEYYADIETVKKRYRELAKQYHPDKNPNNKHAEEFFKVITQGYNVLSEPDQKRIYDDTLRNYYNNKSSVTYSGFSGVKETRDQEVRRKVREHTERKRKEFIEKYVKDENEFPHKYRFILALLVFVSGILMSYNHWFINYLNYKIFYIIIGSFLFGLGAYLISDNQYKRRSFKKAMRIEEFRNEYGPAKLFTVLFLITPIIFLGLMEFTKHVHLKYYYDYAPVEKIDFNVEMVTYEYSVNGEAIARRSGPPQMEAILDYNTGNKRRLRVKFSRINPYISELVDMEEDQR